MDYLSLSLPGGKTIAAPQGIQTGGMDKLSDIFGNALQIMLVIAVVLSLIFLVLGGISWISSNGDKQKIAGARAKITWAIIGLIVALATFGIINLIGYFFGTELLNVG